MPRKQPILFPTVPATVVVIPDSDPEFVNVKWNAPSIQYRGCMCLPRKHILVERLRRYSCKGIKFTGVDLVFVIEQVRKK